MSKPERIFKMGAVRASIFCNTLHGEGQTVPLRKVVLEVRYKDKNGQWRSTTSLSLNELPKAIAALQQAYEYLLDNHRKPASTISAPYDNHRPRSPSHSLYRR